mgnify:FL=1
MTSTILHALNEGFLTTLKLFALTLVFSLPLGLGLSMLSRSSWAPFRALGRNPSAPRWQKVLASFRPIKAVVDLVVWIIRGTPLILQLLVIYYGPGLLFHHNLWGSSQGGRFIAVTAAFVINYTCYFSVIYRGGIDGVPAGQREAGEVLGMTRSQIFFKVTLLQMIKRIVPPMSNEIITLVKDTSLARIIAITEVIKASEVFLKRGLIWPLFFTGIYYLIFVGILTLLFHFIERRLDYFK